MFDRKSYGKKYSREKRERRKAEGRCVTCGVKLTFECTTLQCEHCREKQKYQNVAKVNISKLIIEAKADTVRKVQEQDKEKLGLLISEIEKEKQKLFDENKRLTEENERLRAENELLIASMHIPKSNDTVCVKIALPGGKDGSTYCLSSQRKIVSDTVRNMHSEIKERCIKGGIYPAFVARTIEQVAKEMLEEDQCQT